MTRFGKVYPINRTSRSVSIPVGPVTYDNSAISAHQNGINSGTAFTWTAPVATGAYAVVAIDAGSGFNSMQSPGSNTSMVVTFGGVTLTSHGYANYANTSGYGFIWVYTGNISSAGAGSKTVSVTPSDSGGAVFYGYATSFTYLNVASVGTLQAAYGGGVTNPTAPAVSVPSAVGHRVWGSVNNAGPSQSQSAFSLTARQSQAGALPVFNSGDAPGASSVTVSATIAAGDDWAAVGLDLIHV